MMLRSPVGAEPAGEDALDLSGAVDARQAAVDRELEVRVVARQGEGVRVEGKPGVQDGEALRRPGCRHLSDQHHAGRSDATR